MGLGNGEAGTTRDPDAAPQPARFEAERIAGAVRSVSQSQAARGIRLRPWQKSLPVKVHPPNHQA